MSHACHRFWRCHKNPTFCSLLTRCTIPCACHAKRRDASTSKSGRAWGALYMLTWKCASRHNCVHFFDISTVAILAQGTHWALAAKQAFCPFTSSMLQPMGLWHSCGLKFCFLLSAALRDPEISICLQHTDSSRPMQLRGRTRRKTTAGAAHLLEAGSLTGFAHGDRTNSRPKCKEFLLVTGLQAVSALQV